MKVLKTRLIEAEDDSNVQDEQSSSEQSSTSQTPEEKIASSKTHAQLAADWVKFINNGKQSTLNKLARKDTNSGWDTDPAIIPSKYPGMPLKKVIEDKQSLKTIWNGLDKSDKNIRTILSNIGLSIINNNYNHGDKNITDIKSIPKVLNDAAFIIFVDGIKLDELTSGNNSFLKFIFVKDYIDNPAYIDSFDEFEQVYNYWVDNSGDLKGDNVPEFISSALAGENLSDNREVQDINDTKTKVEDMSDDGIEAFAKSLSDDAATRLSRALSDRVK